MSKSGPCASRSSTLLMELFPYGQALLNTTASPLGGAICFYWFISMGSTCRMLPSELPAISGSMGNMCMKMAVIKGCVERLASIEWETNSHIYRFHQVKTNHFQHHQITEASVKISVAVQSARWHPRASLSNVPSLCPPLQKRK